MCRAYSEYMSLTKTRNARTAVDGLTPDQIKVIIQEESVKIENGKSTRVLIHALPS